MNKLKVYLDTSVISHLDAQDALEKMNDTKELWEDLKHEKYEVILSELTFTEVDRCSEPKRSFMHSKLAEISYKYVEKNSEAEKLSKLYFELGGLPPKSSADAMHIAIATSFKCDIILSWNFKHIVNLRAIDAVDKVNEKENYKKIRILSPTMILNKEE